MQKYTVRFRLLTDEECTHRLISPHHLHTTHTSTRPHLGGGVLFDVPESPLVLYLFHMPNVIHIVCQCGHSDFVIVGFPCDGKAIFRRVRCISCGCRGGGGRLSDGAG